MIGVVTAVGPHLEAGVATRIEATGAAKLARRCADLAELLSAGAAHVAQAAVVSPDVPGLDRTALGTLARDGLRVVGVYASGDEDAQRRLRQLGVDRVIAADAAPDEWRTLIGGLAEAAAPQADVRDRATPTPPSLGESFAAESPAESDSDGVDAAIERELLGRPAQEQPVSDDLADDPTEGSVIAVWGPTGAPGRTTVAVNLAMETARLGRSVILVDADTYGASVGQTLALLDEAPGLAAATRLADTGDLDQPHLAAVAPEVARDVRVLTGLPRADRWSEIREDALEEVLRQCRLLADVTVIDTGFCLEEDEELSYDTRAPRRNIATTTALRAADEIVVVGSADPVGLQRLVRAVDDVRAFTSSPRIVVNRVRSSAVGAQPERRVSETLERFAAVTEPVLVPDDRAALDAAMLAGQALAETAPGSPARHAIARLAGDVAGVEVVLRRRGLIRRRKTSDTSA